MNGRTTQSGGAWRADAIGAAVCLAMCAGAYLTSIRPLLVRHERYAQDHARLEGQRAKAADAAAAMLPLKRDLAAVRGRIEATPLKLQPAQQVNQRLALLSGLAVDAGAAVDDLQPGRVATGTRYDTFPIRFAGTGTYTTCTALLHRIRQTFPDTGLAGLDVSGRPTDPTGQAKFKFDLVWYTAPAGRGVAATGISLK